MDKDPYNLGNTREEKPEGFLSTDELFNFFKTKKIFIKRKDNLPRFCEQHGIKMIKFKREGSGGTTPTAYKIPNDAKMDSGYIAQEIYSITDLSYVVNSDNNINSINYSAIQPYLVKSLQELYSIINQQTITISNLQQVIELLENNS